MAANEIEWTRAHAKPRPNPYQSSDAIDTPEEYIHLLNRFLRLVSYMSSQGPSQTSLFHPDLHLDNIFVDTDTLQITSVIDWQSACMSGFGFQPNVPRMLQSVDSSGSKDKEEQFDAAPPESSLSGYSKETAKLSSHYHELTRAADEHRWSELQDGSSLAEAISFLPGAWSRREQFSFRHVLIDIATQWEQDPSLTEPCPLEFTKEELELHNREWETLKGFTVVLRQLRNDHNIAPSGMVIREGYDAAVRVNEVYKKMLLDMAEDEEQSKLFERAWPYQDHDD